MSRTAQINITVELDDQDVPTEIRWEASDAEGTQPCGAMMLSVWDTESKAAAAIDLWTKDVAIADMNLFFYQAFRKMADTYGRATKNDAAAESIRDFADRFGMELGMLETS